MFRNDRQVARALRVLLAPLHLGDLWTEDGPTDRAVELHEEDGATLSSGERTMLLAAFAFWSGNAPTLRFDALLGLDNANTERCARSWWSSRKTRRRSRSGLRVLRLVSSPGRVLRGDPEPTRTSRDAARTRTDPGIITAITGSFL